MPIPTSTELERYVTIGFWNDPACDGAPGSMHRFPVHYGDTRCYSWPGRSGEDSASRFSCGKGNFSYTQWTTLTCSGGQNPAGTRKTSNMTDCTQDFPPTLYVRVLDFSGCQESARFQLADSFSAGGGGSQGSGSQKGPLVIISSWARTRPQEQAAFLRSAV